MAVKTRVTAAEAAAIAAVMAGRCSDDWEGDEARVDEDDPP